MEKQLDKRSVSVFANNMITLGERIRELREAKGLSLRGLAKQIGITPGYMSDMENGYRHPSDKVLESIAQVLDSTFADLGRYNPKLPIEGLKRLAASNPLYVTALRKVIEKNVSPQDLLDFAEKYQAKNNK